MEYFFNGISLKLENNLLRMMLELWGMRSIPSLLFLPDPLRPGVVAPDRTLSMERLDRIKVRTLC